MVFVRLLSYAVVFSLMVLMWDLPEDVRRRSSPLNRKWHRRSRTSPLTLLLSQLHSSSSLCFPVRRPLSLSLVVLMKVLSHLYLLKV